MLVESARIQQLRDRLPGNLNISFPGVDGELLMLDIQNDIAVSQGAACLSKRNQLGMTDLCPIYVLSFLSQGSWRLRRCVTLGLKRLIMGRASVW